MDATEVLSALVSEAKSNTAAIYRRHGAHGRVLGVPYAAIGKLVKRLRADQRLAGELWETGVHEARIVATKIADPERMSRADLERWIADAGDYLITDSVSALAARNGAAQATAESWIEARDEWRSAAGWNVLGLLAMDGRLPAEAARALLDRIERDIHHSPNRTRHAMNGALIAIGGSLGELTEPALAAAGRIGLVRVDHGGTGCRTPAAAAYIRKMAAHRSRRTRITGARLTAGSATGKARGRSRS